MYKPIFFILLSLLLGCQKKSGSTDNQFDAKGALAETMKERNLSDKNLVGAFSTFTPSGTYDEYLAFLGTGDSGRLVVLGMPSMRILKYVAVFSSEPWQGFSFDDESKALLAGSSRDEIDYDFGDTGKPALSLTAGKHDGRAVFMSDAANGRIAVVDLLAYETKQVISHPIFKNAAVDVDVSNNSDYVLQSTMFAEDVNGLGLRSGITFWKFVEKVTSNSTGEAEKHFFIDPSSSFTVLTAAGHHSKAIMLKGANSQYAVSLFNSIDSQTSSLHLIDWKKMEESLSTKAKKISNHYTFDLESVENDKLVETISFDYEVQNIVGSGNGENLFVIPSKGNFVGLVNIKNKSGINQIDFSKNLQKIELKGRPVDVAIANDIALITQISPNKILKFSISQGKMISELDLPFVPGSILLPGGEGIEAHESLAAVANHSPHLTFQKVSPQMGLGLHLVNFKDQIISLYDASIPQSTRMSGVAMSKSANLSVFKYKIGTDPRTGEVSFYKTFAGKERLERDGKRVHVYATVIRSHITPDLIEVEQDDIVTIHITSQEQSKDQTHGFTIDTYNVHGSWEPGKSAAVTFVADRAGVFPFYCTEFCSALHLEMQGYLLVKPRNMSSAKDTLGLNQMRNNKRMTNFFKFVKGE